MAIELATAYVSLSTSAKGLRKEIDKELGAAGADAGTKAGKSFGDRLKSVGKVGAIAAGGVLAAGLGAALTKGLGRLTAIENAQAKMRGLGHDTETVDAIMKNALASVKGTAFGLGEAATTAAGAVAAGIEPGEKLEGMLKAVANSAAAAGTDMETMGSIFNKAASMGKAQNDVLQQVADRGIPIYAALADQMGVTAEEVFKLASEGKVSFEQFESAMTQASGTVAEEMGKTFTGSLSNAWAALGRVGANLLSGVFDKFAPAIQGVTDWLGKLEPVATKVGEAIGTFADTAIKGLQAIWDVLAKGDFTAAFREVFGVEEDHPFVGFLFNVRDAAIAAFDYIRDTAIPTVQNFIQGFRDGEGPGGKLRDVLEQVGSAAKAVFGWIRDEGLPALQALGGFIINTLWPDVKRAFLERILPAMQEVGRVIKDFWEKDAQPALSALWRFVKDTLAPFLVDFYENGIKPTFDLIGKAISGAWENVIKPTFTRLKEGGTQVKDRFVTVKDGIQTAWDRVSSIVSDGWDKIRAVFDRMKDAVGKVKTAFTRAKDGIADAWATLAAAIARPINKVIDSINDFLRKLQDGLNKIPGVNVTLPQIGHIPIPSSRSAVGGSGVGAVYLARGGYVPGRSPHKRADNVPAMLTAGEYVLPVDAVQSLVRKFGPGVLEKLRRGKAEGTDFGGGGGGWLSKMGEWASAIWDRGERVVRELFSQLTAGFGDSWPARVAKGAIGSTADAFLKWAKENIFGDPGSVGSPVNAPIRWHYGWRHLFSKPDFHTGLDYAVPSGTPVHAAGPGRAYTGYDRLGGNFVGIAHPGNLHTGYLHLSRALVSAGQAITKGQRIALSGNTGTMTTGPHLHFQVGKGSSFWNHVSPYQYLGSGSPLHGAGVGGGVKPLLFDRGGYLPPGTSMVHNATGRPEPLGRMDQPLDLSESTLDRLALKLHAHASRVSVRTVRDHAVDLRRSER